MTPLFDKVVIIGVGQIGASIGLNLVGRRTAREVIGVGRSAANLRQAVKTRAIHKAVEARRIAPLLAGLGLDDLVILATPVTGIVEYLTRITRKPLVIDVGSTKGTIVKAARARRIRFVGCHPIAGTEKGGAAAGDRNLFRGRICVVTPVSGGSARDVKKIRSLWTGLGAKVVAMEARRHDRLFAAVSHLPHVAAYALTAAVGRTIRFPRDSQFIFSGLKGTTRIAASPSDMWRDIFLDNRSYLLSGINRLLRELHHLRSLMVRGQGGALLRYLEKAGKLRRGFP